MYLRVYKGKNSAIAVTLKIYANSSAHTLLQYSVAQVKFVHVKLWLGKIEFRKKFHDIHRSMRNYLSLCE